MVVCTITVVLLWIVYDLNKGIVFIQWYRRALSQIIQKEHKWGGRGWGQDLGVSATVMSGKNVQAQCLPQLLVSMENAMCTRHHGKSYHGPPFTILHRACRRNVACSWQRFFGRVHTRKKAY